jgi:DmsE family decaheme c-type cytochrome
MRRGFFTALLYLLAVGLVLAFATPGYTQKGSDYVGSDACKGCHEDAFKSYTKNVHGKKYVPGSPEVRNGCEACHGPGKTHVDKGGGKGTIIAFRQTENTALKTDPCMSCHGDSKNTTFWNVSKHKNEGVSCDQCHSGHSTAKYNLKAKDPDVCYKCHQQVRFQANKQSHHPIREGKMNCGSCHTPHGSMGKNGIKGDSVQELCFKCHADKRGPFVWEHPPVEENCLSCHTPHGSNTNTLLVAKTPQLCQACHDWSRHPGTAYTNFNSFGGPAPSSRFDGRNCLTCHSQVHGTTGSSVRGKYFLR